MTEPTPPLRAPSANPPAHDRCPNCNGDQWIPVDNNNVMAPYGRQVTMCAECNFVLTQVHHGDDFKPQTATTGSPLRLR